MAEIKTGIFAKNVQKRLNRAQEKVLQKLGKADETKDEQFEQVVVNFRRQESEGSRLQREMKSYMASIKGMQQASINLAQSLHEVYEPDWHGKDDVLTIGKDCDAMWEDFHNKLVDSTLLNLDGYLQQFPDLKTRVAKRSRKLIDYDSARHHMETLQLSGMKNDRKMMKAEDELRKAQRVFDEFNVGLQNELPSLWDSRVGFYISTFKCITNLEARFHREISLVCRQLYEVMTKLGEQHSDKMFTIQGAPSDSGPLRLARTPSPPEDESPPESPVASSNHMLRPVSPGPPRPKSPVQLKKGPPVPPPPKATPTKEVAEEQIIDLFGGEFLPAPSPSQRNERPGESLLDLDFDAFQPDETVSPIPQTAIPWDMWSANSKTDQPDPNFAANWSADFLSFPVNGAASGSNAPTVGQEGAEGRAGGWAQADIITSPQDSEVTSAAEEEHTSRDEYSDRRQSTPGLIFTNEYGELMEGGTGDRGDKWNRSLDGSGSEYETAEEWAEGGQGGGWASAEELSYEGCPTVSDRREEGTFNSTLSSETQGGGGFDSEPFAETQGVGAFDSVLSADTQGGGAFDSDPFAETKVGDLFDSVPAAETQGGCVFDSDPFAETQGVGAFDSVLSAETQGGDAFDSVLSADTQGGGAFDSDPFAETKVGDLFDSVPSAERQGGGAFASVFSASTREAGAFDSVRSAETQGGEFDPDPFAVTQGVGAVDFDPFAETQGVGAFDSDPFAERQGGGVFDSDPFAETQGVGAFHSDPFAETQGAGAFNSDPFVEAQAGGVFDSDPFAETQGVGAFDSDPFAETQGVGAFESDPFAGTQGGVFDAVLSAKGGRDFDSVPSAESQGGGAFDSDPFAETQGGHAFDSVLPAETQKVGAYNSVPPAETQGGDAFDSDTFSAETQGGGLFVLDTLAATQRGGGDGLSERDTDPFPDRFPVASWGMEVPGSSTSSQQENFFDSSVPGQKSLPTSKADQVQDANIPRVHKEPENSDMSEDEAANRRLGKLYQDLAPDKEEVTDAFNGFSQDPTASSFFADFDKMNEAKVEASEASEIIEVQEKLPTPPADEEPKATRAGGEVEEPAAPPSGDEAKEPAASPTTIGEVEEPAAPPHTVGEVEEPAAPPPTVVDVEEPAAAPPTVGEVEEPAAPPTPVTEMEEPAATPPKVIEVEEPAAPPPTVRELEEPAAPPPTVRELEEPTAPPPTEGEVEEPAAPPAGGEVEEPTALPTGGEVEETAAPPTGEEVEEPAAPPTGGEVEETAAPPTGEEVEEHAAPPTGGKVGEPAAPPTGGEVEEPAATPADEELSGSLKEESMAVPDYGAAAHREEAPSEKMEIPSVVIEPASSNEGDDDRDADIISPTAISDNDVTAGNQTMKHMSPSAGGSGLPVDFLYKVETMHDFEAANSDELELKRGDVVLVVPTASVEDQDAGWLTGIKESDWLANGSAAPKGLFPENFIQHLE